MAVDEEGELSDAYRETERVRRPEGQGLNDLYVRFFRMAERRIAEKTGRGVICFISNYSWLDGLSFTGMRERFLNAFDAIRIDCLNGDKYKTGKTTPDGQPDPSIFSTPEDPVGIQVGTAIATLVRKADHAPAGEIAFRHLWGQAKREELTATSQSEPGAIYDKFKPSLPLGLPFARLAVSDAWHRWPSLPELFPAYFPGVTTSRDSFLMDVDIDRLQTRINDYFTPKLSNEVVARRYPAAMRNLSRSAGSDARAVRDSLLRRGGPDETGFIPYSYRPFDTRWLYWQMDGGLLDRPRPEYKPHVFGGNSWLSSAQHLRKGASEPQAYVTRCIGSYHLIERGALWFPAYLRDDGLASHKIGETPCRLQPVGRRRTLPCAAGPVRGRPVSPRAGGAARPVLPRHERWRAADGVAAHTVARLARRRHERRGGRACNVRRSGPRVGRAAGHRHACSRRHPGGAAPQNGRDRRAVHNRWWQHGGRRLRALRGLGPLRAGGAVMPGKGRAVERAYTDAEQAALGDTASALGDTTFDVHLAVLKLGDNRGRRQHGRRRLSALTEGWGHFGQGQATQYATSG